MSFQPKDEDISYQQTGSSGRPVHPFDREPKEEPSPPRPQPEQPRRQVLLPDRQPYLTYVLLGINILVFVIDFLTGYTLRDMGAKVNDLILAGEYWRLVTPLFLHGGFLHLAFNSYFLYMVGPQIERMTGTTRFAAIYFLSGLAGSLASFALTQNPSIGASGALFGVIGSWIPILYRNREVIRSVESRIWRIAQVIGINIFIGVVTPGIDNWAHMGGLLGGLALGWVASPRFEMRFMDASTVRVDDTSEDGIVWLLIAVIAGGLGALTVMLISLK